MPLDFRNLNTLWASIFVETLHRLGLTTAILCPGSRSTPLTVAFARHPNIDAIALLDERSAAFFALGVAKQSRRPVALVCTSGTAAANFFPAIIEARYSRIPLLVFTADRPPELRDCHAGQTIDQTKLYGHYPNWQGELAAPELDLGRLRYLRQTLVQAWARSQFPLPGVVHLNVPLRDPLAPTPQPETQAFESQVQEEVFFAGIEAIDFVPSASSIPQELLRQWQRCDRGIIIAGLAQPPEPQDYCDAIAALSQLTGFPVLAEALSPLRHYAHLNPHLITTYDPLLRNPQLSAELAPELVLQIGELPTSKTLRAWLETTQPHRYILDSDPDNFDPLHGNAVHLHAALPDLVPKSADVALKKGSIYLKQWLYYNTKVDENIINCFKNIDWNFEGKAAYLLAELLPEKIAVFVANSMPTRDVEFFWQQSDRQFQIFFNRGANGIDGTLSTAMGIAHSGGRAVLLTGDLALLHDTNGLLARNKMRGHLTVILINNEGGGIFENLAIANFDPPFEEYFATPQNIDFSQLCKTYGVEYHRVGDWLQLQEFLKSGYERGIRILELRCDRKRDARQRQEILESLAANLKGETEPA
ncbi:2-succinyl-5-enolpyruvyl-6-hydroxy-3-cyclohexene-1-carboxylic-acid synthase [Oscillatoria sp. FACHB-1406]|uniref:2-succinyl-5-enolpyruvyl-6-hydroxy-3- cyclohexene-1-carboxylic-acid synthase n=1 Tax=Oscillatoria sp. FACHB-1406 TaxID=2692846 RepID=UPI0016899243|nr:2-succinyl-5-enolpyruvyl-6-hydroxy-3-cyclohexene-1-carboxylic-acid synthase [Oscillatoria sp. FACHB-1406]MBD2579910.1 2-succinyl-5-enolpyruvyl-6-hydroxy-3-cyclohexene-1-carboxylic-acid synthase [Oscillatoria sp. FACHB-1406]